MPLEIEIASWRAACAAAVATAAAAFSDEVVDRLAAILPLFSNEEVRTQFPRRVREWAESYEYRRWRGEHEDPLQIRARDWVPWVQLRRSVENLRSLLENMDDAQQCLLMAQMVLRRPGKPAIHVSQALAALSDAVSCFASERGRGRGRPGNWPRTNAVEELAELYQETVGAPPTLSYNHYSERRGHFFEFCLEALKPIEGEERAKIGLAPLIARVLYNNAQNWRPASGNFEHYS